MVSAEARLPVLDKDLPCLTLKMWATKQADSREATMATGVQQDLAYEERLKNLLKFNLKKK